MSIYKNDIFLRALQGDTTLQRPPVWMMRQAGRYLPDFRAMRAKMPFFERIRNPEIVSDLTVMPIHQVGVDVAILFSDILVIPQALGCEVTMVEATGPVVPNPIRTPEAVAALRTPSLALVGEQLEYVMASIRLTKEALAGEVPLIGFAGSPWTILCYMVEGKGSKDFNIAKEFCFRQPVAAAQLLQKITDLTILYLQEKVKNGCDVIQIFDSWGGLLAPMDYEVWSQPYILQIVEALADLAPTIVFGKGCHFALPAYAASKAAAVGVDWSLTPQMARQLTGGTKVLQGNLDPAFLLSDIPSIQKRTKAMIDGFGHHRFIANLGHGILPNIPVPNAIAFVEAVKNYE